MRYFPSDIILKVADILTVKGGTGNIIEYFGPGAETISCTGMGTIGNMGAEVGATSTIFPYNDSMGDYLTATRRADTVRALQPFRADFKADEGAEYDRYIEIVSYSIPFCVFLQSRSIIPLPRGARRDNLKLTSFRTVPQYLDTLEPHINGPFTPDLSHPISTFADRVRESTWPTTISAAHIGSCTNSSYEDLSRANSLVQQAEDAGLKLKSNFFIAPGSEEIRATASRDGVFDVMESAGGTMLANACGAW